MKKEAKSFSERFKAFRLKGEAQVWACAAAAGAVLLMFFVMIFVVAFHGLRAFWVPDFETFTFKDGSKKIGALVGKNEKDHSLQLYIGNRDIQVLDFTWIDKLEIAERKEDSDLVLLERMEKGNFIGFLREVRGRTQSADDLWSRLNEERELMAQDMKGVATLQDRMSVINLHMEKLRLNRLKILEQDPQGAKALDEERAADLKKFEALGHELDALRSTLRERVIVMEAANGATKEIAIMDVVRAYRPNQLSLMGKLGVYASKVKELLLDYPRESNTEGGLFPAIFGTILMVFLMSLFSTPLGVVTAVFLREYAKEGWLVNLVRIAVNNLAGVPSIVYGMFGLGFFVYGIGGTLDDWFFSERLPIPTFGTGGLFWASLTMALLTVPVVIVSTEEGLSSVPQGIRDSSIALGATRFQTLVRVVLPMATPGILTGLILSIARAAGEVAPLMLVGVVKIAPSLPADGFFPYLHLERKFMHLGFHIFDVGFQSPNVEAAKPMVYATTVLLLIIVLGMSFLAMYLRNTMKKRYATSAF